MAKDLHGKDLEPGDVVLATFVVEEIHRSATACHVSLRLRDPKEDPLVLLPFRCRSEAVEKVDVDSKEVH